MVIPEFIKKFVVDSVETFIGLAIAANLAFPNSIDEAKALGLVFASMALSALTSAARRAFPAAKDWVMAQLSKLFSGGE